MPPTKKKTPKTASASGSVAPRRARKKKIPTESDIAGRAYDLFVQRGGEHGQDVEDWLMAQRELSVDR